MESILVLVDFDNYACLNTLRSQRPNKCHINSCCEQLIDSLLGWCRDNTIDAAEFKIRLYGGWYDGIDISSQTDLRKMLNAFIRQYGRTRKKSYRILMEAVDYLLFESNTILTKTQQQKEIKLRITQDVLEKCQKKEVCTTKVVADWQRTGCSGCQVQHFDLLKRKCQKNVDTALVADLIFAASNNDYDVIIVVSSDYDMVPGILFAGIQNKNVVLFHNSNRIWYRDMIPKCHIVTCTRPTYK